MGETVRVGIAVVEHNGRYLVGTRQPGQALAGYAEFPGGRCLPSECPRECAARECLEETGLEVVPKRRLHAGRHEYPHGIVELEFWLCCLAIPGAQTPDDLEIGGDFHWVAAQSLQSLRFPDANRPVLEILNTGSGGMG